MNALRTAAVVLLMAAVPSQAQNLLVNGGFEDEPNFGAGATINSAPQFVALTGSQLPGWIIEPGHAVTIHSTSPYPFISGNYSVNMDGEGYNGHNANFYQDFGSSAGQPYSLTFNWQGWQNSGSAQLDVSVIDTVTTATLFGGLYGYDPALHQESASFSGTGNPLRLRIQETPEAGYNDNRFMVDDFSVTAVPEPGTLLLALAGGGAMWRLRRGRGRSQPGSIG